MRQKLLKKIRKAAYGDLASSSKARKYGQVGQTLVSENERGHYQRAKKVVYERMHHAPKKSKKRSTARRRQLYRVRRRKRDVVEHVRRVQDSLRKNLLRK